MTERQLTYDERVLAGAVLDQFAVAIHKMANVYEEKAKDAKGPGQELYWDGVVSGLREAAKFAKDTVGG